MWRGCGWYSGAYVRWRLTSGREARRLEFDWSTENSPVADATGKDLRAAEGNVEGSMRAMGCRWEGMLKSQSERLGIYCHIEGN